MAAVAMNYIVNPFSRLYQAIQRSLTIAGHARAASELARMGYYKESKVVMMELKKLKAYK